MQKTRLILVGGFLGSGKTTLLRRTAGELLARGQRVALITNDQAPGLVDTAFLKQAGLAVSEVSGGCFCCRFDQFVARAQEHLAQGQVDVILGEPVGSCTDLSATVLQPLKDLCGSQFQLAPFVVLVDPPRAREALSPPAPGGFPENVYYIFRKQLEEADAIVLNKADAYPDAEVRPLAALLRREFPTKPLLVISALTGVGLDAWLAFIGKPQPAGLHIPEIDYDLYAEGEAALGWLNGRVDISAPLTTHWAPFCRKLLQHFRESLAEAKAEIAHIKLFLSTPLGSLTGNLTGGASGPVIQSGLQGPSQNASLLINARVHMLPEALRVAFERSLLEAGGGDLEIRVRSLESFSPVRPQPTHRYTRVVELTA
jgi:G3E family GTPase